MIDGHYKDMAAVDSVFGKQHCRRGHFTCGMRLVPVNPFLLLFYYTLMISLVMAIHKSCTNKKKLLSYTYNIKIYLSEYILTFFLTRGRDK